MGLNRKKIAASLETEILLECARRCALCFHLNGVLCETQAGQIAHLDGNAKNSSKDNLAFLCVIHHTLFDSKTSQHKNYTIREVKYARNQLHEVVKKSGHLQNENTSHRHDFSGVNAFTMRLSFGEMSLLLNSLRSIQEEMDCIEDRAADLEDLDTINAIKKRSEIYDLIEAISRQIRTQP